MPIRCLAVDDHTLFRAGLRRLLESDEEFIVVGEAGNAADALTKARELHPDVVLMDIGMPGMSSFDAARLLKEQSPDTRLIFLTMYQDEDYLARCRNAGADGYLLKDIPAQKLLQVVRRVHAGEKQFGSGFDKHGSDKLGSDKPGSDKPGSDKLGSDKKEKARGKPLPVADAQGTELTPRELQVMKMIAEGLSVRQAADQLGLSVKTVEAHKFNLMRKLNLHNRAQLVTYAIRKQIVKMPAEM